LCSNEHNSRALGKDTNAEGNHRKNMVQAVEASLKRLGTDYIDLSWLHAWDQITPVVGAAGIFTITERCFQKT
jgi:aryl-alcohol dehydrogenase-like predicted oxidoreductase